MKIVSTKSTDDATYIPGKRTMSASVNMINIAVIEVYEIMICKLLAFMKKGDWSGTPLGLNGKP